MLLLQEGKIDGVDNENPPNSKLFDPTNRQNIDDVALLAWRRLNQAHETSGWYFSEELKNALKVHPTLLSISLV